MEIYDLGIKKPSAPDPYSTPYIIIFVKKKKIFFTDIDN